MNFIAKIVLASACIVSVAATLLGFQKTSDSPPPSADRFALDSGDGKKNFESRCASCHGLDGRGGERGPDIATSREVQRFRDSEILQILKEGRTYGGMPAFPDLGNLKLQGIVAHVRKLQGRQKNTTALPSDSIRGKTLFFGKGECASCHMTDGVGGYMASDLSAYGAGNSADEIRDAILHPNRDGDFRQAVVTVSIKDGPAFTGMIRNEDNFSLQLQSADGEFHLLQKNIVKDIKLQSKSLMPTDFGTKLTTPEIEDLVHYLVSMSKTEETPKAKEKEEED